MIKWLITDAGLIGAHAGLTDAGGKMVMVSISETYDLSTKLGKMSLIAVHTPRKDIIKKTYPGLLMNSKYVRIVSQDVVVACASVQSADPLQVGLESGKIAPQDLFNPILYKATSNDSFSQLEARLQGIMENSASGTSGSLASFTGNQADIEKDVTTGLTDDFGVYYSLLADGEGFKKAHPQQGLAMKGLVPLVFEMFYANGENIAPMPGTQQQSTYIQKTGNGPAIGRYQVRAMRGNAHPMPKFNTTYVTGITAQGETGLNKQENGMTNGHPYNCQVDMPDIVPVMTAAIIMPPCKLNQLFYRMTVKTWLEFTDIRPIQDITSFTELNGYYYPQVYHSDYAEQSKSMTYQLGMVDTSEGAEIEKIMEGA